MAIKVDKEAQMPKVEIIERESDALEVLEELEHIDTPVALDYETNGINPFRQKEAKLLTVAFATQLDFAVCIPLEHPDSPFRRKNGERNVKIYNALKRFFLSSVLKTAHNAKFEMLWTLAVLGIRPVNLDFDTMLGHYLIDENGPKGCHDLKEITNTIYPLIGKYDESMGIDQKKLEQTDLKIVGKYNGVDTSVTSGLRRLFEPEMRRQGLDFVFREVVMEAVRTLTDVEFNGNELDHAYIKWMTEIFETRQAEIEAKITGFPEMQRAAELATNVSFCKYKGVPYSVAKDTYMEFKDVDPFTLAPQERRELKSLKRLIEDKPAPTFNIKSTPHLRSLLYDPECCDLKIIAYVKKRKTAHEEDTPEAKEGVEALVENVDLAVDVNDDGGGGGKKKKKEKRSPSTDSDVLKILAAVHPIPALMSEGRVMSGIASAFINPMNGRDSTGKKDVEGWICQDGRVRSSYTLHFVKTGRLSSTAPNMQNMPRSDTVEKYNLPNLKKCIISRFEGGKIVQADYSQLELRVLGMYSKDPGLVGAYKNGEDVHTRTASIIFRVPMDKVAKPQRQVGKTINFGLVFEKSAHTLALELIQESPDFVLEVLERKQRADIKRDEKGAIVEFSFLKGRKRDWLPKKQISYWALTEKYKWVRDLIEGAASDMMDEYFRGFPRVKEYVEESHLEAKEFGYVTSFSGRRRRFPKLSDPRFDITDKENKSLIERMLRQANNFKVQSFASDCTMTAITAINRRFKEEGLRSLLINTVHDSIVVDAHPDEIRQVCAIMHDCMENYVRDFFNERLGKNIVSVPLLAEVEIGDNYGEAMKEEKYFEKMGWTTNEATA